MGTLFNPLKEKVGNEELEHWLTQRLNPRIDFRIYEFVYDGKKMVLFHIPAAHGQPITFEHIDYIRIGSITRSLKDFPEKENKLWLPPASEFEHEVALPHVSAQQIIDLLDTQAIFELFFRQPYPTTQQHVIEKLISKKFVLHNGGHYHITNLGALLFAKDIEKFETIARKAVRVIQYEGKNKLKTSKNQTGKLGYANGFEHLMAYLMALLPSNELITDAHRQEVQMYPKLALRELVANALIHQDFRERGTNVMIEIYEDRIEISNPGKPIVSPDRFIDESQSRNESLADAMRRVGLCEEKGSGIDKVIFEVELYQLPAPDFQVKQTHTKVILYAHKDLNEMNKADKIRACYQHCGLCYVSNQRMTNQTLRQRFEIEEKNAAIASRIIRDTLEAGLIVLENPYNKCSKYTIHLPCWA